MTRPFSLGTVLRSLSQSKLQALLTQHHVSCPDELWQLGVRKRIAQLFDILTALPSNQATNVEACFRDIFTLACPSGRAILCETLAAYAPSAIAEGANDMNHYEYAAWCYLEQNHLFALATKLGEFDSWTWWRKRDQLPKALTSSTNWICATLAQMVADILQKAQNRGRRCVVEYIRNGMVDYFVAYPEDHATSITTITDQEALHSEHVRPTFSVVYAYTANAGTLELCAPVPKKIKMELERVFAVCAFGIELDDFDSRKPFQLARLQQPNGLDFPVEAEDGVQVALRRLTLRTPQHGREITCKCDPHRDNMNNVIAECLDPDGVPFTDCILLHATFVFDFAERKGRKKKSIAVDIGHDSSTAPNLAPEWADTIYKYLQRWKIHVPEPVTASANAV